MGEEVLPESFCRHAVSGKKFENFYIKWCDDRDERLARKNGKNTMGQTVADNKGKTLAGWYNGEAAQNAVIGTDTRWWKRSRSTVRILSII